VGRSLFKESLSSQHAESYFPLAEQFLNQSDPAFCGVTSLIMVLNAIGVDPNIRWKGGWRWYGSEDQILDSCCVEPERVRRAGILMEEFQSLGRCQGLTIVMKRPKSRVENKVNEDGESCFGIDEFRNDIISMTQNPPAFDGEEKSKDGGFMVVSFCRSSLGQTGMLTSSLRMYILWKHIIFTLSSSNLN
jgi:glutathione gamma-glutamylcysteinyltransferase